MSKHPQPVILEKSLLSNYLSNFDETSNLEEMKSIFSNAMNIVETYTNMADYKNMPPTRYPPRVEDTIRPDILVIKREEDRVHNDNEIADVSNLILNTNSNTNIEINEKHKQVVNMPAKKWDALTQFYIGSLSVVGLYILFRAMKK